MKSKSPQAQYTEGRNRERRSVPRMLQIKNLSFEIDQQRSELLGYIPQEPPGVESPGHLRWSLEVYCVDQENEQGMAAPGLYASEMTLDVRDWRSLEGAVLQ